MKCRAGVHRWAAVVVAGLLVAAVTACGAEDAGEPEKAAPGEQPSPSATASASSSPSPRASKSPRKPRLSGRPIVGRAPPKWLGKRVLPRTADGFGEVRRTPAELVQRRFNLPDQLPALPGKGFASRVTSPAPGTVIARSTWKQGCPVAANELAWIRLAYWGFDDQRHTGELLVNAAVADDLVSVFKQLYKARFPIEEMRITRLEELDAPPTGDGNNTGSFACRPTRGESSYSQHAYGLAVDVNPFQNPYLNDEVVLPELASSYLERGWSGPG